MQKILLRTTGEGSDSVTVTAHYFALLNLFHDCGQQMSSLSRQADIKLLLAPDVIEVHCDRMEGESTVTTWNILQFVKKIPEELPFLLQGGAFFSRRPLALQFVLSVFDGIFLIPTSETELLILPRRTINSTTRNTRLLFEQNSGRGIHRLNHTTGFFIVQSLFLKCKNPDF